MDVSFRPRYLLDTNITGYIANGRSPAARASLKQAFADGEVMISSITEAEIRFGLAQRPLAIRLRASVEALLGTLQVKPWNSESAIAYGKLCANLSMIGKSLSLMDLLIASQAVASGAILVSHDQAFAQVTPLVTLVDWATDL